jgi:putative membrane protein
MIPVAAFITLADRALYEWYALAPRLWGLSAVDDQRIGGLIMWVPGVLVYWGFMTAIWFGWAMREEARATAAPPLAAAP